jgi:transposase-like protein
MTARKTSPNAPKAQDVTPEQEAPKAPESALSVADVAEQAGVTSKDMRRWLRAQARNAGAGDALPGKGGRYAFTAEQAGAIVGAYGRSKASKGTQAPAVAILAALTAQEDVAL